MKKNKKIGILTLNGYVNYGNRLQNYALQTVLENFGFDVTTIRVNRDVKVNLSDRLKKVSNINEFMDKIKRRLHHFYNKDVIRVRKEIFKKFSYEYINETKKIILSNQEAKELNKEFDYFITGSDQVWNPNNLHGTSYFFLTFADKKKRISYAPSFGISYIEEEDKKNYKNWLLDMASLSVREESGADIIKELVGLEAPVLVDPTLLLTKDDWLKISKESKYKPEKQYILTYFLGDVADEYKKQIDSIAKKNHLVVVNLGNIKEKDIYLTGPSEFIDLVNNCKLMCTDSFHGTVFSIILERPFIVYERRGTTSMYSRIDTLLNKFDLSSRKMKNVSDGSVFEVDFSHMQEKSNAERSKSFNYLKNALEIEEIK